MTFKIIKSEYLYPYSINEEFKRICAKGDLKENKYVLTSPDLTFHADIHYSDDYCFRIACQHKHSALLQFFIFDMNIKKTATLELFLTNSAFSEVKKMFSIRDLKYELSNKFDSDNINTSNSKKLKL